jgi:hypothetical protein
VIVAARTLDEMWSTACERMLFSRRDEVDFTGGMYTLNYDNVLESSSMLFDYDMGRDGWLTPSRWTKLQRDYLDPPEVVPFIERGVDIAQRAGRRGIITQMNFRMNEKNLAQRTHVWGNCLMSVTYRGGPKWGRPAVTVHSRVGHIAWLGALDLSLVTVIMRHIAERSGQELADFKLRWYLDSMSWHSFKSIPFIMSHGFYEDVLNEKRYPNREYPAITASRSWIRRLETTPIENFKFGQAQRMAKRWDIIHNGHGFKHLHVDNLELLPEMLEDY